MFKRKILRGESFDLDEEEEESVEEDELSQSEEESEEESEESRYDEENKDNNERDEEIIKEVVVKIADLIEINSPEVVQNTLQLQEKI